MGKYEKAVINLDQICDKNRLVCHKRGYRRAGKTGGPSFRDARTHLKHFFSLKPFSLPLDSSFFIAFILYFISFGIRLLFLYRDFPAFKVCSFSMFIDDSSISTAVILNRIHCLGKNETTAEM